MQLDILVSRDEKLLNVGRYRKHVMMPNYIV